MTDQQLAIQDTHAKGPEQPNRLITYVLFSYNSEKFIRQALESAFSQTYSPLEIIVSDDCSSDNTFAIIEEMVDAYRGPHSVRAVRTPKNLGSCQHFMLRGREARGDIVVIGEADDMSKPNRVEVVVDAFTPQTGALYSLFDQIDENGNVVAHRMERPRPKSFEAALARSMCLTDKTIHVRVVQGSTAAYRTELFDVPINADRKSYSEEMPLCFYSYLKGLKVDLLNESLVYYRQHDGAQSHVTDAALAARASRPEAVARFVRRENITMYHDFHEIACKHDHHNRIDRKAIVRNLFEEETKFFWLDMSLRGRLAATTAAVISGDFRLSAWCFARLLGIYEIMKRKRGST